MQTLKAKINRYMQIVSWIFVSIMLLIIAYIQIKTEQRRACDNAVRTLNQVKQVLAQNQQELSTIEEEYRQACLNNAETIAYIIQENPSILEDIDKLKQIAAMVEVDEIHFFDKSGRIYAGTHPEYYDYTFDSGEQIGFFKPMLKDYSLKLVQKITPNTAEGKMMQYSAVWSQNGEFIVQVGMEPVNVLKVTEKNELSYIFSLLKVNPEASYYAIDVNSKKIVGSSNLEDVGKSLEEIGLNFWDVSHIHNGFHQTINGQFSFCLFQKVGNNYIGQTITCKKLYQRIPSTVLALAICLISIAFILKNAVTRYMNKYVVDAIQEVNERLELISRGNLNETINIQSSFEFAQLSDYINKMIKSLLANNKKMSYVLSKTNMFIGVYEYNRHIKPVRYTEYIPRILALDEDAALKLAYDYKVFQQYIAQIREHPVLEENGVYQLPAPREQYVKLEEIIQDNDVFGVAIDVTDEIVKRKQIEQESFLEPLTGLYNRRGLEAKLNTLLSSPERLGYSAIIMVDADNLKVINDTYGHDKGDIYLKKISDVLKHLGSRKNIVARFGGDEFVLFLYEYDTETELKNTINALEYIQNHSTAHLDKNLAVPLRFSFGYCMVTDTNDYRQILKEADQKMYENKRARKKAEAENN